ncbi:hypothetical protein C8R44DRAFT_747801 [Mycena epipterygia]|nr:hypothetical protein C8R44DRAFT_747801 [Mycena epipterygia]
MVLFASTFTQYSLIKSTHCWKAAAASRSVFLHSRHTSATAQHLGQQTPALSAAVVENAIDRNGTGYYFFKRENSKPCSERSNSLLRVVGIQDSDSENLNSQQWQQTGSRIDMLESVKKIPVREAPTWTSSAHPRSGCLCRPFPSKRTAFAFALNTRSPMDGWERRGRRQRFLRRPDMTTVHTTSLAIVNTMRQAAENAEIDLFHPRSPLRPTLETLQVALPSLGVAVIKLTGEATATANSTASLVRPRHRADQSQAVVASDSATAATATKSAKAAKTAAAMSATAAPPAATTTAQQLQRVPEGIWRQTRNGVFCASIHNLLPHRRVFAGPVLRALAPLSPTWRGRTLVRIRATLPREPLLRPFQADLTTVSATSIANLGRMREGRRERGLDPQIAAASGVAATALQADKTKNKVIKLTGEVQQIAPAAAAATDMSSREADLVIET